MASNVCLVAKNNILFRGSHQVQRWQLDLAQRWLRPLSIDRIVHVDHDIKGDRWRATNDKLRSLRCSGQKDGILGMASERLPGHMFTVGL